MSRLGDIQLLDGVSCFHSAPVPLTLILFTNHKRVVAGNLHKRSHKVHFFFSKKGVGIGKNIVYVGFSIILSFGKPVWVLKCIPHG